MNKLLKNASTLMIANAVSFLISTLITLIVPKIISVVDYSYFQLYLFYINYLGFFCIGWIDGIVLRYGGDYYEKLEKPVFKRQFQLYSLLEISFSIIVIVFAYITGLKSDKGLVYLSVGIALFLVQINAFFRYLRQAVNDIDIYAKNLILEKTIYLFTVIATLLLGKVSFVYLLIADLLGKTISLIHILLMNREVIKSDLAPWREGIAEAKENISVGIKLLLANGSSMLIVGIIRYSIQRKWDVETFGRISLSLSISNMFILFVQAIGVSLFPILKRIESDKMIEIYTKMRKILTVIMFSLIAVYYPVYLLLAFWLPNYSNSLRYVSIMFPVCIFESKMQLLIEPYLKSLREESKLLKGNLVAVGMSCLSVGGFVVFLNNLDLTIISIVGILAIRSVILEKEVCQKLKINLWKDISIELVLAVLFIVFNWFIGGWIGFILYLVAAVFYGLYEKEAVVSMMNMATRIFKK